MIINIRSECIYCKNYSRQILFIQNFIFLFKQLLFNQLIIHLQSN